LISTLSQIAHLPCSSRDLPAQVFEQVPLYDFTSVGVQQDMYEGKVTFKKKGTKKERG
jgi:hypothetical protein